MVSRPSILSVGNFDGVHRGHRALVAAARREAAQHSRAKVIVASFEDHPANVLRPEQAPACLTSPAMRTSLLLDSGVDEIAWLKPSAEFLDQSPREFVATMQERHQAIAWVEGPNFRFGKDRAGDINLLRDLGAEFGFSVVVINSVEQTLRDKTVVSVSSTMIRWLIEQGRIADANLCLGEAYAIRGDVMKGEQRGREIGFPTVNLDVGKQLLPADGVYGGMIQLERQAYAVAVSVGKKPTFHNEMDRIFEAYILDFDGNLYGKTLECKLLRHLRPQLAFSGQDSLIRQINRDVNEIRGLFDQDVLDAAALAQSSVLKNTTGSSDLTERY